MIEEILYHGHRQGRKRDGGQDDQPQQQQEETTTGQAAAWLGSSWQTWAQKASLAAALIAGAALRVWHLNAALWYDEAFTAWLAQLPLPSLLAATAADVHPPLYYLIVWLTGHLLGYSEIALRLPSLVAGFCLIPVVYRLATCLHVNRRLAVILISLSPFQIYYSQEARSYALLTLAVALAGLGLLERRWWLAVAGSLAALYMHNTAVLFIGPLWLVSIRKDKVFWLAAVVLAVTWLPGAWWTITQAQQVGGNYWIPPLNHPGRLIASLDDLYWFAPNSSFVFATGLITSVVLCTIIASTPRLIALSPYRLIFTGAFAPLLLLAVASVVWQPMLISRVLAPSAPFFMLLIAVAWRRSFALLGGPVLILLLLAMAGPLARPAIDNEMLNFYGQQQPGDAMYHANVGSYVVWKYYRPDIRHFLYPQNTDLAQTLSRETRQAMGTNEIDFDLIKCAAIWPNRAPGRWWLIYFHNPTTTPHEIEMVSRLTQTNPSTKIRQLRNDSTTNAALVLVEPECNR